MSSFFTWFIILELTLGLAFGGYVLYQIQTTLALIIMQHCSDEPDDAPLSSGLLMTDVLTPEVLDAEPARTADDTDTTGTFTGAAWK